MVVFGPGIKPGNNSVLGTNVDYAPTWLAMAGIATPSTMDGRSILAQVRAPSNPTRPSNILSLSLVVLSAIHA